MPPERKPASTESDAPEVGQILSDGPAIDENHPEYAFHQAIQAEESRPPAAEDDQQEHEDDGLQVEEGGQELPHDLKDALNEDTAQEAEEEVGGDDDDGEVTISKDEYTRIVEMLGLDINEEVVEAAEQAATPAQPEPVKEVEKEAMLPIEAMGLNLPKDDNEFIDIMSSADAYNQHVSGLIEHAVTSTLARVEPLIAQRAQYIYQAQQFNQKFFEKHPDVPVQLAIKGLAAAQRKLGPEASWDDLFSETEKNCAFAEAMAQRHKKATSRGRDNAGRFSPKTARQSRPSNTSRKLSPTEEALQEISQPMTYAPQDAQFLRDVGAL